MIQTVQQPTGIAADRAAETSSQESVVVGRMHSFCARIVKTLAPPLLREIESVNARRQEAMLVTPRRSVRLAKPVTPMATVKPKKGVGCRNSVTQGTRILTRGFGSGRISTAGVQTPFRFAAKRTTCAGAGSCVWQDHASTRRVGPFWRRDDQRALGAV